MIARVDSDAISKFGRTRSCSARAGEFMVRFKFEKTRLSYIYVEKQVVQEDVFQTLAGVMSAKHPADLKRVELIHEARELLQYIESLGSFWFDIQSIDIANLEVKWIRQGFREKYRRMLLPPIRISSGRRSTGMRPLVVKSNLEHMLDSRELLEGFVGPMSFYREGINELANERFRNAYVNFFFLIEGIFGNGKYSETHLVAEFMESDVLKDVVSQVIDPAPYPSKFNEELDSWFKKYSLTRDVEGTFHLMVKVRNNLHHYNLRPTSRQPKPIRAPLLDQSDYDELASLLRLICIEVYVRFHGEITGNDLSYKVFSSYERPSSDPNKW